MRSGSACSDGGTSKPAPGIMRKFAQKVIDSFIQQLEEKMQLQVKHVDLDAKMSEAGYAELTLHNMLDGLTQAILWYVDLWDRIRRLPI